MQRDIGRDRKGKVAAVMDTAEPAAGRMTRVEGDAKSELVLYKRMKRNGHNHPVMAKGEVKNGRVSWRLFRSKEPGRVSKDGTTSIHSSA